MLRTIAFLSAVLFVSGCSTGSAGDDDVGSNDADFASVPSCSGFDLKALIERTNDRSPDYQCEVSPGLSRSSQPDERWIRSLSNPDIRKTPFRSVVNLRGENGANGEDPIVRSAGMKPLNIRVTDMHAPTREQAVQFLEFVTARENQPALVHCKAGQGRTGTFVATYRMAVQGWAPADAIAEARAWNVNDEQIGFLQELSTHLGEQDLARFRAR